MTTRTLILSGPVVLGMLCFIGMSGCSKDSDATTEPVIDPADMIRKKGDAPPKLIMPDEVLTDDPSLNAFVRRAANICLNGNYGDFRLLWSTEYEPFSRRRFESAWHAVRSVEVKAIKPVRAKRENIKYYIHATAHLDPQLGEPRRDLVVLVVDENGEWRIAPAPEGMRDKILGIESNQEPEDLPSSQPADRVDPGSINLE